MREEDELLIKELRRNATIEDTYNRDEASWRLEAVLSDKLLWFNPYLVPDRDLIECAERGYWLEFPSLTQMLIFHFHDIRAVRYNDGKSSYDALFFHIGNSSYEHHLGFQALTHPLTHRAARKPVWTLINGRHIVPSNIKRLEGKSVFIGHAISCEGIGMRKRQAYRMHLLYGSEAKRATIIRESMCEAKLEMLNELIHYSILPEYLGISNRTFDVATPVYQVMAAIQQFPSVARSTNHIIG